MYRQSGAGNLLALKKKPVSIEDILFPPDEFAFLAHRRLVSIRNMVTKGRLRVVTRGKYFDNFIPATELVRFGWTEEMLEKL